MTLKNKLEKEIETFLDYLTVELGLSVNTRESYGEICACLQPDQEKLPRKLPDDIVQYLQVLKAENYAATSSARKLAALEVVFPFYGTNGRLHQGMTCRKW